MIKIIRFASLFLLFASSLQAQRTDLSSATASVPGDLRSGWMLTADDLRQDQYLLLTLQTPGNIDRVSLLATGLFGGDLKKLLRLFVTYDPMNPGSPVDYTLTGAKPFVLSFSGRYGAHVKLLLKGGVVHKHINLSMISVHAAETGEKQVTAAGRPWLDPHMPLGQRVETLLAAMTPADKMELLREGWGIPGIPRLGIPALKKVEAIHGFSYGSGATIFPQSIGLGATWDEELVEKVAMVIGDETVSAHAVQAWSPVLDVAQDPRWGRCEETYGEDHPLSASTLIAGRRVRMRLPR